MPKPCLFLPLALALTAGPALADEQGEPIVVTGERLRETHVRFAINRKTRAVTCKASDRTADPTLVALKCQLVTRCSAVEPYSRANVRACLEREYAATAR